MSERTSRKKNKKTIKRKKDEELEELEELEEEELEDEDEEYEDEDEEYEDEDEEYEDEDEPRRSRKAKKKKGFPVGGLIFMFLLIAVILAAGYFGLQYMDAYSSLKGEFDGALQAAEADRDAAAALYAEANPDSAANAAERQKVTDEMIAGAKAEIEALREESEKSDAALREAEQTIRELQGQEDYDYYRAIYDQYVEGRAYVEDLLSGD